jgi:hypothetical protein
MGQAVAGDRLLYRALVASLALHLVLIVFIPPLAQLSGNQSVETLSFVRIVQIHVRTPPPPPPHELPAAAPVRAPVPRVSHVRRAASAIHTISRTVVHASPQAQRAPIVAAAEPGGAVSSKGAGSTVAPSAPPQENSEGEPSRQAVGGYMPLGADEPAPVLDPAVHKALTALGVHVTLTVTVDSSGHTEDVSFEPPIDQNIEQQIRTMLASASWDPAVCGGGVTCEGQATIKL